MVARRSEAGRGNVSGEIAEGRRREANEIAQTRDRLVPQISEVPFRHVQALGLSEQSEDQVAITHPPGLTRRACFAQQGVIKDLLRASFLLRLVRFGPPRAESL